MGISTTINFKGYSYTVKPGEIFQAFLKGGKKNEVFNVQCNDNETVTLKVLERISYKVCLLKVEKIEWEENLRHYLDDGINRYESTLETKEDFNSMSKKELIALIDKYNLNINKKKKKAEIIAELKLMSMWGNYENWYCRRYTLE